MSFPSNNPRGLDLKAIRRRSAQRHEIGDYLGAEERFHSECYRRRWHIEELHGVAINVPQLFTLEECLAWWARGFQVPVDLWGEDVWKDEMTGHFRFGEEALGADF